MSKCEGEVSRFTKLVRLSKSEGGGGSSSSSSRANSVYSRSVAVTSLINQMRKEDDPFQLCAYLCSLLICFFPGLTDHVTQAFKDMSVPTIDVDVHVLTDAGMQIMTLTASESLTYMGQAIFLIFKNIEEEASYTDFMNRRIRALKAVSGVVEDINIPIIVPLAKARSIRRALESAVNLKIVMVEMILATEKGEDSISSVCSYIAGILEGTGMGGIDMIYETLILTESPVLQLESLAHEVRNVEMALAAVYATDHPKFFNLLHPPSETRVTQRSRFPTLAAFAQHLKQKANPYAFKHSSRGGNYFDSELMDSLQRIHQTRKTPDRLTRESLKYFGMIHDEDDEDDDDSDEDEDDDSDEDDYSDDDDDDDDDSEEEKGKGKGKIN